MYAMSQAPVAMFICVILPCMHLVARSAIHIDWKMLLSLVVRGVESFAVCLAIILEAAICLLTVPTDRFGLAIPRDSWT